MFYWDTAANRGASGSRNPSAQCLLWVSPHTLILSLSVAIPNANSWRPTRRRLDRVHDSPPHALSHTRTHFSHLRPPRSAVSSSPIPLHSEWTEGEEVTSSSSSLPSSAPHNVSASDWHGGQIITTCWFRNGVRDTKGTIKKRVINTKSLAVKNTPHLFRRLFRKSST